MIPFVVLETILFSRFQEYVFTILVYVTSEYKYDLQTLDETDRWTNIFISSLRKFGCFKIRVNEGQHSAVLLCNLELEYLVFCYLAGNPITGCWIICFNTEMAQFFLIKLVAYNMLIDLHITILPS